MSDCVLFGGLFAAYAVLQSATYGGASISDFSNPSFVLLETMLLLVSSFAAGLALLAAKANRKGYTVAALLLALVLGTCFLALELQEFAHLIAEGYGPSRSAFLSSFFTLVGTHGAHVFFGSLWLVVLLVLLIRRGLTEVLVRRLEQWALFWHFLDLIWICIFTFVYLFGIVAL